MAVKTPRRAATPNVSDALAAMQSARAHGRGRKSAIYLWFLKNHDALAEAFALNAPAWTDLAAYLAGHGLKDGNGNTPTARGTRDVWFRVRQEVKQRPPRVPSPVVPATPSGERAPGIAPVAQPLPAIHFAEYEPAENPRPKVKLDLKPAMFRAPSDKDS